MDEISAKLIKRKEKYLKNITSSIIVYYFPNEETLSEFETGLFKGFQKSETYIEREIILHSLHFFDDYNQDNQ